MILHKIILIIDSIVQNGTVYDLLQAHTLMSAVYREQNQHTERNLILKY